MPFETPDLPTLNNQAASSIEAELPGTDARLRRSNLNVLSRVMAGFVHGVYGYLRRFLEECLPWNRGFLLEMWAGIWKVYRKAAAPAAGKVTFTGANGTLIDLGTEIQTADGRVYETVGAGAIAGDSALVPVMAVVPGTGGNLAAGTQLALINPVAGLAGTATVDAAGVTNGSDIETLDQLYARFLHRVQNPAHGGSVSDYVDWALEVPGVTRVWVAPDFFGLSTVLVLFVRDGDASNIPDAAAVAQVQAYIDQVRPITAHVQVAGPQVKVVDFTIVVSPNTEAVREAVAANLADLFRREADAGATLLLSHVNRDISLAGGEIDHTVYAPVDNVVCAANEMAVLGTITWG